jgi:hypothetical protein
MGMTNSRIDNFSERRIRTTVISQRLIGIVLDLEFSISPIEFESCWLAVRLKCSIVYTKSFVSLEKQ